MNKHLSYNRISVVIEDIEGTVFESYLIQIWEVRDVLEKMVSDREKKMCQAWSQNSVALSDTKSSSAWLTHEEQRCSPSLQEMLMH